MERAISQLFDEENELSKQLLQRFYLLLAQTLNQFVNQSR